MNDVMKFNPSDAACLATMRRIRGGTAAANEDAYPSVVPRPTARELHQNARVARSQVVSVMIGTALVSMHAAVRRAWTSYRVYRDARETLRVLRGLDDHTLRDLGYHRSEIDWIAVESSAAHTR